MQVELSNEEINVLDKALLAWEKEPDTDSLFPHLIKLMRAGPDATPEDLQKISKSQEDRREAEILGRRRCATFIRAKLFSVQLTRSHQS